jgi:hypothetical protein
MSSCLHILLRLNCILSLWSVNMYSIHTHTRARVRAIIYYAGYIKPLKNAYAFITVCNVRHTMIDCGKDSVSL